MAQFSIASAWTPDIWINGMREAQATFPSILNSGIAVETQTARDLASGAGISGNLPFFLDITDQSDAIQVEDTAPSIQGAGTDKQVAPILNRVTANGASALSGQVSGADPVQELINQMVARRMKQRNATLIALVRGAFAGLGAASASAPLSANRVDSFDESGTDATADQTFNADLFINAKALLGELQDSLNVGGLLLHPNVLASLEISDKDSFKTGVESQLGPIRTYRGVPVFTSSLLVRAGTSNGYVYDSYLFSKGVVGVGEKPQVAGAINDPVLDVASLNIQIDAAKNNYTVYDRTRFVMHLNGMKWTGTPSGQSATNAELGTVGNWSYVLSSASRAGIVSVRTNA